MKRLKNVVLAVIAVIVGATFTAAVAPAGAAGPADPVLLKPAPAAHWQPFAGLPDSFGPINEALVTSVSDAGMPRAAMISGLEGKPTSTLGTLSFATPALPGGIEPCWDVGYTNPDGTIGNLMVNPTLGSDFARFQRVPVPGTDWTTYSWGIDLPPGSTINTLTVGIDVANNQSDPVRVSFDNISAAGRTWTWVGDNFGR